MPPLRTYNNKSVKDIVNTKLVIFTMQGSVEIIDDLPVKISDSNTVNVRYMNTRKHMYMLFNYDNDMLCYDDKKKGIYRSVVVSYPEARVLSFAPPKTLPYVYFQKIYPEWRDEMHVNEYIEGCMIQLFYDSRIGEWEISTEKCIGGLGHFSSFYHNNKHTHISMNFRKLFVLAMGGTHDIDLNNLPFLEYLSKEMSYTFILQQPTHDIQEAAIPHLRLYLIAVYFIGANSKNSISYVSNSVYEKWDMFTNIHGLFEFPKRIAVDSYVELDEYMNSCHSKRVVIANMQTGVRSIITTREYRRIQSIQNTHPRDIYQFLCLNRINQLYGYLHFFPKLRKTLMHISDQYTLYIEQLRQLYAQFYIHKNIKTVPERYSIILQEIHKKLYVPSIKTKSGVHINRHVIREFLNTKDPYEVLHLLQM